MTWAASLAYFERDDSTRHVVCRMRLETFLSDMGRSRECGIIPIAKGLLQMVHNVTASDSAISTGVAMILMEEHMRHGQ